MCKVGRLRFSQALKIVLLEGFGPLESLIRLLRALESPEGPHKALKSLIRTLRALQGLQEPYKALKSLIRP